MRRPLTILAMAAALGGCAAHDAEVRVTEYGGSAGSFIGRAVVGGCRIVQMGETTTRGRYAGERCTVEWGDAGE